MNVSTVGILALGVVVQLLGPVRAAGAESALVEAVKRGDEAAVEALLADDVEVDARQPDGATALHWAAHLDAAPIARQLIQAGATVDVATEYGLTPLSLACAAGGGSVVELLLSAGADPNLPRPTGETPLMRAASTGSVSGGGGRSWRMAPTSTAPSQRTGKHR